MVDTTAAADIQMTVALLNPFRILYQLSRTDIYNVAISLAIAELQVFTNTSSHVTWVMGRATAAIHPKQGAATSKGLTIRI